MRCVRCTRLVLARYVLQAVMSLFAVRDSGDSTSHIVPFFCFVLRYDSFGFGPRNFSGY